MDLYSYFLIWFGIVGLCLGSFYNVVILRSLSGESIVFPPSKCPKCGNKLYFWHNIPVISYILLRGKCYFCKEKISIQYPLVELITMLFFIVSYIKFGMNYITLFVLFWISCLIIMTVTDIKEKLVDCNIAIAMCISGIVYHGIENGWHGILHSILGMLAGIIIMEIIARSGFLVAKTRAMGEADTYVSGALGAIFGIFSIVKVLLASLFASMIFILPIFIYNKYKNNDKRTCVLFILFILSLLTFYLKWQNYLMLYIIGIIGILLAYSILHGISKDNRSVSYLPYVPALSVAALYYIFF